MGLIAAGREADVFDAGDGRVLRRYRDGRDASTEAVVMNYLGEHGYPVPQVYSASGPDIFMERVVGPTMATAALAGELDLLAGAEMLADLLARLHTIPARDPAEETVVHLDLHPENVMLTERGPMVVDWAGGGDGPADLDTAFTALILAQVAIGSIPHPLQPRAGRILDQFLICAPGDPLRMLDRAVELRREQDTMSAGEIAALPAAAARVRGES
jgi:aminoglycoside phosphotransferase (APT) family kinase protein